MSDKPAQLFGSMGFDPKRGAFIAEHWAALRAGDKPHGLIQNFRDKDGKLKDIMWFADIYARNDFISTFGGMSVTLSREQTNAFNNAAIQQKTGAMR